MDTQHLKQLLETCFTAKRVIETLPALPEGMKPRHIHVLEAVMDETDRKGLCRVSDVSARMNITMPSISRLIRELEAKEMLRKQTDARDHRVVYVMLTESGNACLQKYVTDFHRKWAANLQDTSNEQAEITMKTIEQLFLTMPGGITKNDR